MSLGICVPVSVSPCLWLMILFSPQHFLGLKRLYSDYPDCFTRWNVISYNANDYNFFCSGVAVHGSCWRSLGVPAKCSLKEPLKGLFPWQKQTKRQQRNPCFSKPEAQGGDPTQFHFSAENLAIRARRQQITITLYCILPSSKLKLLFDLIHYCTRKKWIAHIS